MPVLDKPLAELEVYTGINPKPVGFDDYWQRALDEVRSIDPCPVLERAVAPRPKNAELFDLWFTSVGGARIYAKYARPKIPDSPAPAILEFHGYSGQSGEWQDRLRFTSEGVCVAAMDCRGQAGKSQDAASVLGNTLNGHIIRGLAEGPEKLLFRSIFLDTVQLFRVISSLDEVDSSRISSLGGSQGGALSIACASLEPRLARCVAVFPFLSDYKRVWEMDLAKDAYAELKTYFRNFDPTHNNEEHIFEALGHIDVHHLAPRIRAETLMAITLQDNICPPSTQFAIFNSISARKSRIIYPDFGHEHLPGFPDIAFDFLTWNAPLLFEG